MAEGHASSLSPDRYLVKDPRNLVDGLQLKPKTYIDGIHLTCQERFQHGYFVAKKNDFNERYGIDYQVDSARKIKGLVGKLKSSSSTRHIMLKSKSGSRLPSKQSRSRISIDYSRLSSAK